MSLLQKLIGSSRASWFFSLKQKNLVNITYVKRGRRATFVRKALCEKQSSIRPVLYDQYRKLTLVYCLCFTFLQNSDSFQELLGLRILHCPCVETILNTGLLSLYFAPLSHIPRAETDRLQLQIGSEASSWHFFLCVHVVFAYACMPVTLVQSGQSVQLFWLSSSWQPVTWQ